MQNTYTCIACHKDETIKTLITILPDRFVCSPCLFPTSLETMADRYADLVAPTIEPETEIDTQEDDLDCEPETSTRIMPSGIKRDHSKARLPELFKLGIVNRFDKLSIVGKAGSDAMALDADTIQLTSGVVMNWNTYGQRFTGHKAVNVYKHVLVNGVLLQTLRAMA